MSWTLTKKLDASAGPGETWVGVSSVSKFHSSFPLSHSSPPLIGLLTPVDVKQQYSFTTGHSSTDHREVRTALNPLVRSASHYAY